MSIFDGPAERVKSLERQLEEERKPYTEKDTCVMCGRYVPEGTIVCEICKKTNREPHTE